MVRAILIFGNLACVVWNLSAIFDVPFHVAIWPELSAVVICAATAGLLIGQTIGVNEEKS